MEQLMQAFLARQTGLTSGGRPLEELLAVADPLKDPLKGAEGQRLRTAFSEYGLVPDECEDTLLCSALMNGNMAAVEARWLSDIEELGGGEAGKALARTKWENYKDSPNRLPIYDILQVGAWTCLVSTRPGGGVVPERHTAFQHSVSCTPLVRDVRWSEILLNASKDPIAAVNHRSRYGATALHSCVMSYKRPGEDAMRVASAEWLFDRGANVDIPDNDGMTPRGIATSTRSAPFLTAIRALDQARASSRGYCSPGCQKMDWRHHKKGCKVAS
ncbi:hypothetical protein RQP46_007417 [Phenoliferia psychrophenolica]